MEFKPDSDEAVGPLNLPRPKGKEPGCFASAVFAGSFGIVNGWLRASWGTSIAQATGRSKTEANLMITLVVALIVGLLWWIPGWFGRKRKPLEPLRLEIGRRAAPLASPEQRFAIWSGHSLWSRAFMPLYRCFWSVVVLIFGLSQSFGLEKVLLCGLACLILVPFVDEAEGVFQPLLVLDGHNVQAGHLVFPWTQIDKIEVEHLVDSSGGFYGTRWSFFDSGGQRLSRATVPKERCWQQREEEMLAYAAQMLGNEVAPVAPPTLHWI